MARKGNQKVRTGCFTCKIRKIKCDEGKPSCHRCTSTGRKCDGYPPRPQGVYSWNELLTGPVVAPPTIRIDDHEGRALDFFRRVVAPTLSGHSSPYFWNQLVSQVGQNESVIRHAAIAISSLYEHSEDLQLDVVNLPKGQFALNHYNMALKQLRSSHHDEAVVIFACILFICIEILQNNKDAAIDHCKHGVMILNASTSRSGWAKTHILPVLLRLSIFPFFFGRTADTFPCIGDISSDIPPSFAGLDDCRLALDTLTSRTMRFVRSVDHHCLGIINGIRPPPSVYLVQSSLTTSLQSWHRNFIQLKALQQQSSDMMADLLILEMKYLVSKIWVDTCLETTEMGYDRHNADFQVIVDSAQEVLASKPAKIDPPRRPKFIFEMGFLPLLYFVVLRCRVLGIRVSALRGMMALSARRENLFDSRLMRGIGRRVIELEHNIKVDQPGLVLDDFGLPPDEVRIRDAVVTADTDTRLIEFGQSMVYKRVCFLGWAPGGGIGATNEWVEVTIHSEPRF